MKSLPISIALVFAVGGVKAATVVVSDPAELANPTPYVLGDNAIDYTGSTASVANALKISTTGTAAISVSQEDTTLELTGDVTRDKGSFAKRGGGTLKLSGNSVRFGDLLGYGGTLLLAGVSSFYCENFYVSGGTVSFDGTAGKINGNPRIGWDGATGRQACELLSAMFARGGQPVLGVRMNVLPVVRRTSTRRTGSDARIKSALEFIRQFATSGIKVDEVVKVMGCSRRTADLLFKRHVGHSILSELTETRLARVKELLRTDDAPVSVISDMCGFGSVNDLDRVFKLHTGRTPNNWRRG